MICGIEFVDLWYRVREISRACEGVEFLVAWTGLSGTMSTRVDDSCIY